MLTLLLNLNFYRVQVLEILHQNLLLLNQSNQRKSPRHQSIDMDTLMMMTTTLRWPLNPRHTTESNPRQKICPVMVETSYSHGKKNLDRERSCRVNSLTLLSFSFLEWNVFKSNMCELKSFDKFCFRLEDVWKWLGNGRKWCIKYTIRFI